MRDNLYDLIRTIVLGLFVFCIINGNAQADAHLQQLTTIPVPRDSSTITSVTSVGDFNADGFPDLAVGVRKTTWPAYEADYLFYGGVNFDSLPDLIFRDSSSNQAICPSSLYRTLYGDKIAPLSDFNGDGFDDFATSAPSFCDDNYLQGRVYVYFGGPNPDTAPDLIINGSFNYDRLGQQLGSGNFYGNTFSDFIVLGGDRNYGFHLQIYSGGNPPDTSYDWYYYAGSHVDIYDLGGGYDPDGDSYDEFGWNNGSSMTVFAGGDTISHLPMYQNLFNYAFCPFDISGDNIDDFTRYIPGSGYFLCLGSANFDTIPDYFMGWLGSDACRYHWAGQIDKVLGVDAGNQRFILSNISLPPDTIPFAYVPYNFDSRRVMPLNAGDMNGDGTDEILLTHNTPSPVINIYAIATTGIDDNNNLPTQPGILSAYPNPFNSATTLTISNADKAEISLFDITGRLITSLHAENGRAIWNASAFPSGLYIARVEGKDKIQSMKLILLK
jgi:hypothetical protein